MWEALARQEILSFPTPINAPGSELGTPAAAVHRVDDAYACNCDRVDNEPIISPDKTSQYACNGPSWLLPTTKEEPIPCQGKPDGTVFGACLGSDEGRVLRRAGTSAGWTPWGGDRSSLTTMAS